MKKSGFQNKLKRFARYLTELFGLDFNNTRQVPKLIDLLEQAQREWNFAKLYFNSVTDPDLIDYAIFCMDATEKKYIYLLKQAREAGIRVENCNLGESC